MAYKEYTTSPQIGIGVMSFGRVRNVKILASTKKRIYTPICKIQIHSNYPGFYESASACMRSVF